MYTVRHASIDVPHRLRNPQGSTEGGYELLKYYFHNHCSDFCTAN